MPEKQPLSALIVEDERNNAEALAQLLTEFCEDVVVAEICNNVQSAYKACQKHRPDVVFLDIELPGGSGFTLFDYFVGDVPFGVVFTTAYNEYAIKAFECAALDYLLKPVELRRLKIALEKVRERKMMKRFLAHTQIDQSLESMREGKIKKIGLSTHEGLIFIEIGEIIRCQGESNYTTFYLVNNRKYLVSKTLKEYELMLEENGFFRTHKSHLINLSKVKRFTRGKISSLIMEDGSEVPVSIRKKETLMKLLPMS